MKRCRVCAAVCLGAWAMAGLPASGAEPPPTALGLFNAWLATAARTDPQWRTEIRAEPAGATPAPGRTLGRSPLLGVFSYRPRSYAELSPEERRRLLRDPQVRRRRGPALTPGRPLHFAIQPEEMRQNRPFVFTLPLPAPE